MTLSQCDSSQRMPTANWDLHCHETGSGHRVILLHGSGVGVSGRSNFSANLSALAKHFPVLAVDMPGWGESDPCSVEKLDHVSALFKFMDALGIPRAGLLGNLMRGRHQRALCSGTRRAGVASHHDGVAGQS